MSILHAELVKLAGLPSAWAGAALGALVPPALAFVTASATSAAIRAGSEPGPAGADSGFQELAFGVVGAIVLGVVAIGSEYCTEGAESAAGRQIATSLIAVPSRRRFLAAKAGAVVLAVTAVAVVSCAATLGVTRCVLTSELAPPYLETLRLDTLGRAGGVVVYWVLTALLAHGLTLLTRNGILPLTVLLLNTSVVSVTYLLSKVTPLAGYLPDLAGARLFIRETDFTLALSPMLGGLVMSGWVLALLATGAVAFARRDT